MLVHLGCFAAIWTGVTAEAVALCVGLYWLRIFAIGAGYHRYFSHRSYSTGRVFQFLLACVAQSTTQKSVLWWGGEASPSPSLFRYGRGCPFAAAARLPLQPSRLDLRAPAWRDRSGEDRRFRPLSRADAAAHRFEQVPSLVLAGLCFLIAGWSGLVVGFLWSTVLVYHGTFCINSLAHVHGRKRYVTGDDSLATTGCSRSSPWARAGTTTIIPIRAASARASAGGNTTRPSMC
ncbi:MAG: hypothetical protein WDN69_37835 [Aliidongia sp.]